MIIEILTAILVIITAIYAYLTFRMTKASEENVKAILEQSESISRPYIIVEPFVSQGVIISLRVKNAGKTSAKNVTLKLNKDFYRYGESEDEKANIKNLSAFSQKIDSIQPSVEYIFHLAQAFAIFADDSNEGCMPKKFRVIASYEFPGKQVIEENIVDLMPFLGSQPTRDPIVDEIKQLRNAISKNGLLPKNWFATQPIALMPI